MRKLVALGLVVLLAGGAGAGWVVANDAPQGTAPAGSVWTCPMHPQVVAKKAGACPICHMHLVEKKGAAPVATAAGPLAPYFEIRRALAGDDIAAAVKHAHHLGQAAGEAAKTAKPAVSKALQALAEKAHALGAVKGGDAKAARTAFGEVSKAALAYAKAAKAAGCLKAPAHVFHCPMAKPYGTWLQADGAIGNPYYGKSMLKCGREVETIGASGGASSCPDEGAGKKGAPGSSCCGG